MRPKEPRKHARQRAGLFWLWLAERKEIHVVVVTHSKLIKHGENIWLLGDNIPQVRNGEAFRVVFE